MLTFILHFTQQESTCYFQSEPVVDDTEAGEVNVDDEDLLPPLLPPSVTTEPAFISASHLVSIYT